MSWNCSFEISQGQLGDAFLFTVVNIHGANSKKFLRMNWPTLYQTRQFSRFSKTVLRYISSERYRPISLMTVHFDHLSLPTFNFNNFKYWTLCQLIGKNKYNCSKSCNAIKPATRLKLYISLAWSTIWNIRNEHEIWNILTCVFF